MLPPELAQHRLATLAAAILLVPALLSVPVVVARAAAPTAMDPRPLVLEAGPQVGFRFGANGTVIGRKQITLRGPAHELAVARTTIPGRGIHLLLGSGPLSGYYVAESIVAYVQGVIGSVSYEPPVETLLPRGTVIGYRFDDAWHMTSAVVRTIGVGYRRPADRVAVINGRRYYHLVGGPWDGSWVPAAVVGRAQPLACATGPRAPVGARQVVRRTANAGHRLALTFDMGGRLVPALSIMRYLLLNGVCSTIFATGVAAGTPTGQAVLEMVSQYPELFEVGNHTMNHCDLVRGGGAAACPNRRPTDGRLRRELTDAAAVIEPLAGQSPVPYWRPPFGSYDTAVLIAAASVSYTKTILWDIDTIDWRPISQGGPTADQIAAKVVAAAQDGSVVLNHLGGYRTRSALPAVLFGLRHTRGMEATSISDLLARQ
jgi:peptidoglycan/xylan/chitin deacetylase (PgdA/CDA1 family)